MLRVLSKKEKEDTQRKGYMCEHLLCLSSMVSNKTALYNDDFPVFISNYGEADVIMFGLMEKGEMDGLKCVQDLSELPIDTLNIVSPKPIYGIPKITTRYVDWDFHIDIRRFDFDLRGNQFRNIRNRLRQAERRGYSMRLGRELTPNHTYVLSRHMARHQLEVWDYDELLSLERFFREHSHGQMMEVYKDKRLVGFDVVDFFEERRIMTVPLGIYLESSPLSDFLMHENLKYAREMGYEFLDVGLTCGSAGLKHFKEKWFAEPKFKIYVQKLKL